MRVWPGVNVVEKAGFGYGDFPKVRAYLDAIRSRPAWKAPHFGQSFFAAGDGSFVALASDQFDRDPIERQIGGSGAKYAPRGKRANAMVGHAQPGSWAIASRPYRRGSSGSRVIPVTFPSVSTGTRPQGFSARNHASRCSALDQVDRNKLAFEPELTQRKLDLLGIG